jgi:hypothetical protein
MRWHGTSGGQNTLPFRRLRNFGSFSGPIHLRFRVDFGQYWLPVTVGVGRNRSQFRESIDLEVRKDSFHNDE